MQLRFVGHLVELAQPEAYDTKYSKWVYADLPIFPDELAVRGFCRYEKNSLEF